MDKLCQIGDVAKLFHLSVSSLHHYEQAGLLQPQWIDPDTGYRHYSTRQFEVLNTIRYLRVLDMPLSEIADFLQNRNVEKIEEKLHQQKETVIRKLKKHRKKRWYFLEKGVSKSPPSTCMTVFLNSMTEIRIPCEA